MALTLRPLLASQLVYLAVAGAALAEPMDLSDPQPRWVSARFEVSPADRPAQLDSLYTPALPAWLEPGDAPGLVKVTVTGRFVEQYLLAEQNPVAGSFGEFVWVFDAATGHAVAEVAGRLVQRLDWGLFASHAQAEIQVRMTTQTMAGYERPRRLLGQLLYGYCWRADDDCTLVAPASYDPATGYVNAVGEISARSVGVRTRTFSPLGEARFTEIPEFAAGPAQPVSSPPR